MQSFLLFTSVGSLGVIRSSIYLYIYDRHTYISIPILNIFLETYFVVRKERRDGKKTELNN